MRILFYLYPAVLSQGPEFNGGWSQLMGQLMRGLQAAGGCQCHMITASRFAPLLADSASELSVSFVDEVALQRELFALDPLGAVPTAMSRHARSEQPLQHAAVVLLVQRLLQASAGFDPDVVITFSMQAAYLKTVWPDACIFHVEAGALSRNPYPFSLFFDHQGMYGASVAAGVEENELSVDAPGLQLVADLREHSSRSLSEHDPFKAFEFRRRFPRLVLLPLQVSNFYSFDEQAPFRTQFEYLLQVLSAAPIDVGVIVTEYIQWGEMLHRQGSGANLAWLRRSFPNMIFHEEFRGVTSASQSLLIQVDGVISIASNLGYQALLHGKRLATGPSGHVRNVAHDTDLATFFSKVVADEPAAPRDHFMAWYLERYAVPYALACDGKWLLHYLQRRLGAIRTAAKPEDAFVAVAPLDELRSLWLDAAASSPPSRLETELARNTRSRAKADVAVAQAEARLQVFEAAATPMPGADDRDGYLLLNDTRAIDGHLHLGCNSVTGFIESRMRRAGLACLGLVNWANDCAQLLESTAIGRVKLVIFNGEGSVHHDSQRIRDLMAFCQTLKQRGVACVLINSVWHENSAATGELLTAFDIVSVRESTSLAGIQAWRPDARLVPDLSFASLPLEPKHAQAADPSWAALTVVDHVLQPNAMTLAAFARYHELPFFLMGGLHVEPLIHGIGSGYELEGVAYPRVLRSPHELPAKHGCVVGRYHGLIAALCAGTPVVALASNTPKIEGMLTDIGVTQPVLLNQGWLALGHVRQRQVIDAQLAAWSQADHDQVTAYRRHASQEINTLIRDVIALVSDANTDSPAEEVAGAPALSI